VLVVGGVLTTLLVTACDDQQAVTASSAAPASSTTTLGAGGLPVQALQGSGPLGRGFVASAPPAPGATMLPAPGSWTSATPPPGFRVVLLATDEDAAARTSAAAVTAWSQAVDVDLRTIPATDPDAHVEVIQEAIDAHPDLVVSTGDTLVDALALVTASWLDQEFLVVGAQLPEPTANVTAAIWAGADYRGEGLGDPAVGSAGDVTPQTADDAVRAGVAAVVSGWGGHVVRVGT
jgi:hypothetical protein